VVAGELLRWWGVAYAGPLTRVTGSVGAPELIVAGPFAYVRNPLYVGNILMYAGVGIMANALFPWLLAAAVAYFIAQYALIVSLEEEFLAKQFGAAFDEYRASVPRFFPSLRRSPLAAAGRQRADWRGGLRSERRTLQAVGLVVGLLLVVWGVS
jgi:protein-S-isoprenylcysteine O-methyltransferase Ste14